MKVCVTGGRKYPHRYIVWAELNLAKPTELLVGDALGADLHAREWFHKHKSLPFPCVPPCDKLRVFAAGWDLYGRSAGPRRNTIMLETLPDLLIAFPGGKGTLDCCKQASRLGIPILEIENPWKGEK